MGKKRVGPKTAGKAGHNSTGQILDSEKFPDELLYDDEERRPHWIQKKRAQLMNESDICAYAKRPRKIYVRFFGFKDPLGLKIAEFL